MSKNIKDLEYISNSNTLIGTKRRELIDVETGEQILVDQINKLAYGTKNFWKCYLMDFLSILGIFDSKQVDVFVYIAENTNPSNNVFLGTYDKIVKDTGVSRPTIAKIMKKLQEHNFIKKIQNGAWLINPNILMKGNDNKRQMLITYYSTSKPIDEITKTKTSIKRQKQKAFENDDIEKEIELIEKQMKNQNNNIEPQNISLFNDDKE